MPKLEELQGYLWRRAIIANTSRMLLHPTGDEGTVLTVGFVDIVGYTSQSRLLSESELEQLVEHFESVSNHAWLREAIEETIEDVTPDVVKRRRT